MFFLANFLSKLLHRPRYKSFHYTFIIASIILRGLRYTVHLSLVAQRWHCCSKMLYRLLTHTNRHLHKASCSASVTFRVATVNRLFFSSVSLCTTKLFIPEAAALWLFLLSNQPLSPSHRIHYISSTLSLFFIQILSLSSDYSLSIKES